MGGGGGGGGARMDRARGKQFDSRTRLRGGGGGGLVGRGPSFVYWPIREGRATPN